MMPIILTQRVIERRENISKAVDVIRAKGFKNSEIIDRLEYDFGIDFIDYRELFSSSQELCSFLNIANIDSKYCWLN